ncbi:hypothetical protein MTR67_012352 [Solanum verrucosum]|uniref:Uncharacterized protein n=1 Tax=Solanum verrucosum TaxID=315347 RepID=A0AAF0TFV5_SOLVR|nr:hypothetical protein MTR67_012352 [Solanum verrucosum]
MEEKEKRREAGGDGNGGCEDGVAWLWVEGGGGKLEGRWRKNEDSPTDSAELKIGNRSKRDLDAENLNLHHEKM